MAKVNPVKLRQDADAAERAGKLDKAIEALKLVVQENPRDWNTINRIGDLYAKLNNVKGANDQYVKVARYFADDGFYLKAIAVWKKVLRNDASLLEGHIALGDLYAKQGLAAEAKQTFAQVYDEYVKRNKLRDAGEVLRRMAEVDPSDLKVRIRLAELYGREGDTDKAAGEFLAIADELVKKGLLAEALQLLEKALRGAKRSPRLIAAIARVHMVQKDFARAAELLQEARRSVPGDREIALRLAEASIGAKRLDDARAALSELLKRDPGDEDARQQLGQVFLAEGRYDEAYDHAAAAVDKLVERRQLDRAAGLLQQIVQRNPSHVRTLAKLVEVFRLQKNDQLVVQTYSQLVEAYLAAGALDQAASVVEMLVELEPHNEQHRSRLRWLREQLEGSGAAPFDLDLAQPAAPAATTPPAPAVAATPARPARAIELSGPLSAEDQEFINEHLAEGRVFRKYGLGDKARDQLEAVLGRFPDQVDALRELADLYREKGDSEAAAQRLRVLAEVLRLKGDAGRAARVDEEVAALGPAAAPAAAPSAPAAAARPAAPAPAPRAVAAKPAAFIPLEETPALVPEPAAPPPPADLGLDITVDESGAHEPARRDELPADEELDYVDLESIPSEPERPTPTFDLSDLAPGGEIGGQFLDEDELPPEPGGEAEAFDLEEPAPPPAPPAPRPSRPAPASLSLPPSPPAAPPPSATSQLRAAQLKTQSPAPAKAPGVPAELQRAIEEIESYVSMGFVEDARGVLQEANSRFPNHPALRQRLDELGLELPGAESAGLEGVDLDLSDVPPPAPEAPPRRPAPAPRATPPPRATPAPRAMPPPKPASAPRGGVHGADEPLQLGADFFDLGAPPAPVQTLEDLAGTAPEPPPSEDAAPSPGFDLASELGDLFGAQAAVAEEPAPAAGTDLGDKALADIFREFQKGVEKQLGKEDYETRYNLGIAYKEMGLVDEAIGEFQLAAKDDQRFLECASMLGICFLEKGMPKLAVKWFEKGLATPGRTEEEYQGLRYDLGGALEQAGENERALALYSELYGQDASFRDVAERIRRLSARD